MVTQAAASVIGRVCAQATAGEIFCERVYSEMREYLGQVRTPLVDGLAEALPVSCVIAEMLVSIFCGESIALKIQAMRETAGRLFEEFSDISIDSTVNIMQSITGNIPEGKVGPRLPEQERCCLSVKGRTGCVLFGRLFS